MTLLLLLFQLATALHPAIAIKDRKVESSAIRSLGAAEAIVQVKFAAVNGMYSTCKVQLETEIDDAGPWLKIGPAVAVNVSANANNAWRIVEQAPGANTALVSATDAVTFGANTRLSVNCTRYGIDAPATVTVILN